jgi:hypothetical protein
MYGAQRRGRCIPLKYFFHMEDGACIRDPHGEEFSDDAGALREAVNVARGLANEGLYPDHWRVVVKDANGLRIGSVPLAPSYDEPAAEIAAKH